MRIRIYHSENGCVRVTKEMDDGNEMTMFSNVKNGKVAIIDIHAPLSLKAELNRVEKKLLSKDCTVRKHKEVWYLLTNWRVAVSPDDIRNFGHL